MRAPLAWDSIPTKPSTRQKDHQGRPDAPNTNSDEVTEELAERPTKPGGGYRRTEHQAVISTKSIPCLFGSLGFRTFFAVVHRGGAWTLAAVNWLGGGAVEALAKARAAAQLNSWEVFPWWLNTRSQLTECRLFVVTSI